MPATPSRTSSSHHAARLARHVHVHPPAVAGADLTVVSSPAAASAPPLLTIALRGVKLGDAHDCTDSADTLAMTASLFDALVRWGPGGEFEPALASSWTVSGKHTSNPPAARELWVSSDRLPAPPEDCRTWTFHMVSGVVFHNGERCDAAAAAYSLRRMARPDIGATLGAPAVWAQYLEGSVVTALDPLTVSITTVLPIADLLDIVAAGPVLRKSPAQPHFCL